jgi:hypothetical protein
MGLFEQWRPMALYDVGMLAISANGTSNGIIWASMPKTDGQWQNVPGRLVAFHALLDARVALTADFFGALLFFWPLSAFFPLPFFGEFLSANLGRSLFGLLERFFQSPFYFLIILTFLNEILGQGLKGFVTRPVIA